MANSQLEPPYCAGLVQEHVFGLVHAPRELHTPGKFPATLKQIGVLHEAPVQDVLGEQMQ